MLAGAYWQVEPGEGAGLALAYTGAVAPEVLDAFAQVLEDAPDAGLLAVPSPDLLHRDWSLGPDRGANSHARKLLSRLAPGAGLVTVIDGPPSTLSWLGGVLGHRVAALGVQRFGQSGDIQALYEAYGLDAGAILDALASLI
jgi:pyruvate dehydrogenase E1 component